MGAETATLWHPIRNILFITEIFDWLPNLRVPHTILEIDALQLTKLIVIYSNNFEYIDF